MDKLLFFLTFVSFVLCSCGNSKKEPNTQKRKTIYVVGHESEIGKYGEGTYINSNSHYKDKDGNLWHRDDIFAPKPEY